MFGTNPARNHQNGMGLAFELANFREDHAAESPPNHLDGRATLGLV
jgi:hypothetical protein